MDNAYYHSNNYYINHPNNSEIIVRKLNVNIKQYIINK